MDKFNAWFDEFRSSENYKKLKANPVAYFCMEYALPDNLPIYAGGLGVLAGDYVIGACQEKIPMVGIGLYYSKKFVMDENGDEYRASSPYILGLEPVEDKSGKRVKISVPIGDKTVFVQAWKYEKGTIPIYLLDTNCEENEIPEQLITDILYVSDQIKRLKQEMVLGIGGVRLLTLLGIKPSIYHMNEGHSAFLCYEATKELMKEEESTFEDAFEKVKKKVAFTNHTIVAGAHDSFEKSMMAIQLELYAKEIGVSVDKMIEKGLDSNKQSFSTTHLAFEAATKVNAVSKLHADVASKLWSDHPMEPITNGIALERWDKIGKEELRAKHQENKANLLDLIRREVNVDWDAGDLVVGWARRIAGYKRPMSFLEDLARAKTILNYPKRPVRVVFAGYPHYNDGEGRSFLYRLRYLAENDLKGSIVYLENYSTELANLMVSGCDIWLNTPVVGMEACGTSGMKAALNGTLPCSTNDGWLQEVDLNKLGFTLNSDDIGKSVLDAFAGLIAPMYYESNDANSTWEQKMQASRQAIVDNFGVDRMLKDYIEKIYLPMM